MLLSFFQVNTKGYLESCTGSSPGECNGAKNLTCNSADKFYACDCPAPSINNTCDCDSNSFYNTITTSCGRFFFLKNRIFLLITLFSWNKETLKGYDDYCEYHYECNMNLSLYCNFSTSRCSCRSGYIYAIGPTYESCGMWYEFY